MNIEILPRTEATKYLGRKVSFDQYNQTEIDNRIAAAWKKFWSLKSELTSKRYSLHDRLRLFEGTVTPTFLYGSATWTITRQIASKIQRTQRRMLRMILGVPRRQPQTSNLKACKQAPSTTQIYLEATTNRNNPTTPTAADGPTYEDNDNEQQQPNHTSSSGRTNRRRQRHNEQQQPNHTSSSGRTNRRRQRHNEQQQPRC